MPASHDRYALERFVEAQERVYDAVLGELRSGRKRSHWIWFVFPQLRGLGHSPAAQHYGISSLDEARAYLAHDVLGPRLRECTRLVGAVEGRSVEDVFGYPDYLKVRSCMTLFAHATDDDRDFVAVLDVQYRDLPDGREDPATLELLAGE